MQIDKQINNSLPLILKAKLFLARIIIIWENSAIHLFKALLFTLLFTVLILIESFS